ncbi:acetyltransferase [Kiloniella spongiae]|uniref:Acetyltransferase n=1 Tax=Kiloniella spongiae TaxID=1489064 RepID=A0A0H2MBJ6_9PROT|nr:GNAT family N-acetyltransferase [Kiloniella spongiae]KLN59713.1 acetyltransferase [Kiloniella spongiae]
MIRKYETTDTTALVEIWSAANKVAHPFLSDVFVAQVAKDMRDIYLPNAETWVLEFDQKPIGFIALINTEIGGLFLDPEFHGKRLGKALVDHAVKLKGSLSVEVFEKNKVGRRFYDLYGFVEVDRYCHEPTNEISLKLTLVKD